VQTAIDTCILIFVSSTMLAFGLRVPAQRVSRALREIRLLVIASLVNVLGLPALGVGIASAFDIPSDLQNGFILIAISPGAPFAIKLVEMARGELASSIGLLIILQLVGLVSVPLLAGLFLDPTARIDVGEVLANVLILQLFPLLIGFAGQNSTRFGARGVGPANVVSNLSFALLVILVVIADTPDVVDTLAPTTLLAIIALQMISLATGFLLGGSNAMLRRSLAILSAARKGGLALIVATTSFGSESPAAIMVIAYSLIELVLLTGVAAWWRRKPLPV